MAALPVWAEIETAKRMNLPVVVVVLNNQNPGYQKHAELSIFGAHTDVVIFQPVDHAAIAKPAGSAASGSATRPSCWRRITTALSAEC